MPAVYEYSLVVGPDDIDELGHASNVAYVSWMQSAAIAHSTAQGWPPEAYVALGAGWVVRRHEIDYRRPAVVGDRLAVRTWVATMEKVSSQRQYEIRRCGADEQLAAAVTQWAFVDYATGKPRRIPAQLANSFEVVAR